jgi:hypothetical protein
MSRMIGRRGDARIGRVGSSLAVLASFLLIPSPAHAHSELESSRPADGSKPKKPPAHIVLNFSETPAENSVVKISDPCTRNLVGDSFVAGKAFHVQIDGGTGGKYRVDYSLISAEDGHPTKGTFSFTVKGPADCSPDEPDDEPKNDKGNDDDDVAASSDSDPASDEDDSSSPMIPIALGGLGLVVVAALARFATRK